MPAGRVLVQDCANRTGHRGAVPACYPARITRYEHVTSPISDTPGTVTFCWHDSFVNKAPVCM